MSHRRSVEEKRRMKNLYEETWNKYATGVWIDKNNRFRRWWPYSSNFNSAKYFRNVGNRRIRRMNTEELLNRGQYKKAFDLWWTLY